MTKSSPIRPFYDEWARLYDSQPTPATKAERGVFMSFISLKLSDVILEIGCGTGRITIPLSKKCKKIIGVDFSDRMLALAEKKSAGHKNIELRKLDVRRKLPFKNATFDKVVCPLAINHIENLDLFFGEIHRVLKRNGRFIFDDVNPDGDNAELRNPDLLAARISMQNGLLFAHSITDLVHSLHRVNFEIEKIKFTRYDKTIKHFYTLVAYQRNKGLTFGLIVKARKS